jgi:hypothetical protein
LPDVSQLFHDLSPPLNGRRFMAITNAHRHLAPAPLVRRI